LATAPAAPRKNKGSLNIMNWTKIEDALPKTDTVVLALNGNIICTGFYLEDFKLWIDYESHRRHEYEKGFHLERVSHWQPLPELPSNKSNMVYGKMKLPEAIKTLEENIPPPDNEMVDFDHLHIAVAWKTIKENLCIQENKVCVLSDTDGNMCNKSEE
jgi:hypothetical protein